MSVVPLPASALRLGHPMPFAVRDAAGQLLIARGTVLESECQREQLAARGVFIDLQDARQIQKAMAGKVDEMVRRNALLGEIAQAQPALPALDSGVPSGDAGAAWAALQLRTSAALRSAGDADSAQRLRRLGQDLAHELERDADSALLVLVHETSVQPRHYGITHSLLVAVVCELAARFLAWPADWRASLRGAALTMNIAMRGLQDELALQAAPPTPPQRALIDAHAGRGAALLREAGLEDEAWLEAVEHHHRSEPGRLADLPKASQLARLIQRADIFAARLSPRRNRAALSGAAAAQAAYLDENRQPDDAGSAIVKATGIYPPGSFARLASGEIAVVLRRGRRADQPMVASIVGRSGAPLGEPARRDTRLALHAATGGVAPHEVKVRLSLERLLRLV